MDAHFPNRLLAGEIGPEAGNVLLLVDRERMGLPLGLAGLVRGSAHVCREEAASGDAEPLGFEQHGKAGMVGQVPPDREVADDIDAERTQPFRRADPGALQMAGLLYTPALITISSA